MPYLFAATLFVSAALLFWVEPLVGKMVLPLLGGSPSVWNTCLVFFQAALLAGYLYAHASSTWLRPRGQAVLHLALLAAALLLLPIALPDALVEQLTGQGNPVPGLLRLLLAAVGLPFIVIAGSAPLLQKWFAGSGHPSSGDPYFLYAASNLGSMLALLAFPFLLEPTLALHAQRLAWACGFVLLLLLTAVCAAASVGRIGNPSAAGGTDYQSVLRSKNGAADQRPTLRRQLRWLLLAAIPSSLLLGVTTYVTTDLAAVPLLWVIPLALYLLSFILVFAGRPLLYRAMVRALPIVAVGVGFHFVQSSGVLTWQMVPLHWLALFVASMVCHGELAKDRPAPRYLTGFYLWLSLGGVLGGLVNVFLAPPAFQAWALEYPLALLLACVLAPALGGGSLLDRGLDLFLPAVVCMLVLVLGMGLRITDPIVGSLGGLLIFAVPAIFLFFSAQPLRFSVALVIAALVLALPGGPDRGTLLHAERNFFGMLRIQDHTDRDSGTTYRQLSHGTTLHGIQRLGPGGKPQRNCEPLMYYHRSGPIGRVIEAFQKRTEGPNALPKRVAAVGLGVGCLASYARPGEEWTFYEIDPAVQRVAEDERFFTYLADSPARPRIELGDARLRLQKAAQPFGLIVQDAFSSDVVPLHLLTRQALHVYNDRRARGGLLAFHISNRYLDLRPVLADLARDAGMVCYYWHDKMSMAEAKEILAGKTDSVWRNGKSESVWVVLTDRAADLGPLAQEPWERLDGDPIRRVWDDDFSNLLQVFHPQ